MNKLKSFFADLADKRRKKKHQKLIDQITRNINETQVIVDRMLSFTDYVNSSESTENVMSDGIQLIKRGLENF